jgi:hypothetical protein
LFYNDDGLVFYDLGLNSHLLVRRQRTFTLCFLPHALYSVHNVTLLRKEGIAKVGGPLDVIS